MDIEQLNDQLSGLPIPQLRSFDQIGSTNDEALNWIAAGAEDGCLVIAEQQTQGRGRLGRRWVTKPGAALAFSLILRPIAEERERLAYFSPLGALAICQALEAMGDHLQPQIKWPNDVLLQRRKTAGILVEAAWEGDMLQGIVVGIGINVGREAVPPPDEVLFPATSVEEAAGEPVDRLALLRAVLGGLFQWRAELRGELFRQNWEQRLAFKNEWVTVQGAAGTALTGQVTGLDASGNLLLRTSGGELVPVTVGDVHLRLLE
jgi:BirA family transcriptional regulator, biotin operon repressor / biotin---[acetyl-CoA-carboxylase] ligase